METTHDNPSTHPDGYTHPPDLPFTAMEAFTDQWLAMSEEQRCVAEAVAWSAVLNDRTVDEAAESVAMVFPVGDPRERWNQTRVGQRVLVAVTSAVARYEGGIGEHPADHLRTMASVGAGLVGVIDRLRASGIGEQIEPLVTKRTREVLERHPAHDAIGALADFADVNTVVLETWADRYIDGLKDASAELKHDLRDALDGFVTNDPAAVTRVELDLDRSVSDLSRAMEANDISAAERSLTRGAGQLYLLEKVST